LASVQLLAYRDEVVGVFVRFSCAAVRNTTNRNFANYTTAGKKI
jgi:hypothetical protein